MSSNLGNFLLTLILLGIIVVIAASPECIEQTACSCHLHDGTFYDLSKLSSGPYVTTAYNYSSSFQPCKNINVTMEKGGGANKTCKDVSLCVLSSEKNATAINLGNIMETKWDSTNEKTPKLILSHAGNTAEIILLCCSSCTSTSLTMDVPPKDSKFHYLLASPYACRMQPAVEGLSTGSVLVILLFVFSGVYLLIGALALRFFRGAIGWELIPNYDFWSDLPALVRDGIAFTFNGCSAESYDRI